MSVPGNPTEIAREAFRQLAIRRVPPTPDNYREIYAEVSGQSLDAETFPEKQLRQLAAGISHVSAQQQRLERELDEAIKNRDWARYKKTLTEHVATLAETRKLAWGELIHNLFRYWEAKSSLTPGKKREALEHVLNSAAGNPRTLFTRLENLQKTWAQGGNAGEDIALTEARDEPPPAPAVITPPPPSSGNAADLLPEFRALFAYILEICVASFLEAHSSFAQETGKLVDEVRAAHSIRQLQDIQEKLRRFAYKLELLGEDQNELRGSLLKLLRLLVENISELVLDDQWLHGQIEVVREIMDKPLSQRALDDAEQRLKEVIFKQGQLKLGLQEAREALKTMLASFVDHLADFADTTSDYHDKIEHCAARIGAADNINELESVLAEVMRETRGIQLSALRSRDEMMENRKRARETEERVKTLEKELAETSQLIRHDQLTGVLNRRGLEEVFDKELARSRRHETPMCLALLDIDNFKKLNDALGHAAGDEALIHLITVIRETLRPQDTVARFGGEEFIILFPETDLEEAAAAMIRVQRELTRRIFLYRNRKLLITFSAGVAQMQPGETQATITQRADTAMYAAKQSGKNQVIIAPEENAP
jgi:diguanylate cyclase